MTFHCWQTEIAQAFRSAGNFRGIRRRLASLRRDGYEVPRLTTGEADWLTMIAHEIDPAYRDAVAGSLPPGEKLVAVSSCYIARWNTYGFMDLVWVTVVLTNISVRHVTWQRQPHSYASDGSGWRMAGQAIPEVMSNTAWALSQITALSVTQTVPVSPVRRELKKVCKTAVNEITVLSVQVASGGFEVGSPYSSLQALTTQLEAFRSGSLLVQQAGTLSDAVERLAELKQDGVLTDDEFDRAKAGFVGLSVEVAESSASLLRQLHSLLQGGVLSESEFRMKKWDVLSRKR